MQRRQVSNKASFIRPLNVYVEYLRQPGLGKRAFTHDVQLVVFIFFNGEMQGF